VNSTLKYFQEKWGVDLSQPSPLGVRYSRYRILDSIRELDFKVGAEIGTEHGTYARKICGANPQLKLYCVDPYMVYPYYGTDKEQDEVNTFYEAAVNNLAPYDAEILKMTSMEAVKQFEDNSLDFVFIDGNHHFEWVVNDVIYWSRKVKPGGIVYGHDYSDAFHVKQAVNAYMSAYKVNPWFIMHTGGKIIDCWMFVRQEEDQIF
jgi:hypothetical protein